MPTLQRSSLLWPALQMYAHDDLVDEVIVINNAGRRHPIRGLGPKVRVLDQDDNIFVNPAWNLGVAEAQSERLIIANDDVLFPPGLIGAVSRRLNERTGIIGPHPRCVNAARGRRPVFMPAYERTRLFGILFFMSRECWVPIPDELLVWCGDDWLFNQQTRRNYYFVGPQLCTQMATTSGAAEFAAIKYADQRVYRTKFNQSPYRERFRHESAAYGLARAAHRLLHRRT